MSVTTSPGLEGQRKGAVPGAQGRLAKLKPQQIFGQELESQWGCGGDMTKQRKGERNPGFSLPLPPSLLPVLSLGQVGERRGGKVDRSCPCTPSSLCLHTLFIKALYPTA